MTQNKENDNLKIFLDSCDNNTLKKFLKSNKSEILSTSKKDIVKCLTIKDFFYNTILEEDIVEFMTQYYLFEKNEIEKIRKECKNHIEKHITLTKYGNAVYFMINPETMKFTFSKGKGLQKIGLQEDEVVGRDVADYYGNIKTIMNGIHQAAEGKERYGLLSVGDIHFDVNFTPVFDDDGKVIEVVGMAFDISKHMELEQELKKANIEKDRFFSIIAHDLKGPFGAVVGLLNSLKSNFENSEPKKVQEYIGITEQAASRSYDLLIDLLELSKSKSLTNIKTEDFNLRCETLEQILKLNPMAKRKNITIQNNIPENITISADKDMFNIIISNLITNSIKFTGDKGKEGEILISGEDIGSYIIISVTDNGTGMSPEKKESLFKIDQINSTKGTNDEYGTGLGLTLCKEFVEKHEGKIRVAQSELGKGTTIKFTMPKASNPDI